MPEAVEDGASLGALLRRHIENIAPDRGPTRWLAENALDGDGKPVMNASTAVDILKSGRREGWLAPHRMKAIARSVSWPDARIYIPNAIDLGLDPPPDTSVFGASLPRECDRLPAFAQAALREQAIAYCRLAGLLGNTD